MGKSSWKGIYLLHSRPFKMPGCRLKSSWCASKDGSVGFTRQNYPEIKVLVNSVNQGFSYTCNQGIHVAKMELVMLLNSDVALEPNYFEAQWKYFNRPDTFGVMGRIINPRGEIEDAARKMAFQGWKFKATRFYELMGNSWTPTAYLSGANALVDRKKLLELGGFDETFSPFYVEDVDLSFRAWRLGWTSYFEPKAVCQHEVSSTTKKVHAKKNLYPVIYRNKFILQAIHLNGWALWGWYLQMVWVEMLPRLLVGKLWIWSAFRNYLQKLPEIRQSKINFQQKMTDHQSSLSLFEVRKNYFDPKN